MRPHVTWPLGKEPQVCCEAGPRPLAVSIRTAATALDTSQDTVRRMIAANELPTIRVRGGVRIPWADLQALAAPAETVDPT